MATFEEYAILETFPHHKGLVSEIETDKLYQFTLDCYNNGSVSYNNPDRDFLKTMCCDTDNMSNMKLDTWQFGGVYETYQSLLEAVAASMEYYLDFSKDEAVAWLDENEDLIGKDKDDYSGEMFWDVYHANMWDTHYQYILSIDPATINWLQLAEDLWGDDIERNIALIDDDDDDNE